MDSTPGPAAGEPRYPPHHRVARRVEPTMSADLHATLDARRDLGPEYEGELVDGFLERLDQAIDARVDARLAQARNQPPARRGIEGTHLALAIVTTSLGIPLTAITTQFGDAGILAFIAVWAGIILVNLAAAVGGRRR